MSLLVYTVYWVNHALHVLYYFYIGHHFGVLPVYLRICGPDLSHHTINYAFGDNEDVSQALLSL